MEWLLAPIDGTRPHEVGILLSWHGRTMVLAWAFLIPGGVLMARFFKVMPGQDWPNHLDNRAWWHSHLVLQHVGAGLTAVGLALVLLETRGASNHMGHWAPGYFVVFVCLLLVLAGWLRGSKGGPTETASDGSQAGDHYDMTPRRVAFEYVHKFGGYAAVLASIAAVFTGLWHANAPRWMWVLLGLWWLFLIASFVALQRQGRALDTYQAIWGTDDRHPGNRMKPIGWGIKRR